MGYKKVDSELFDFGQNDSPPKKEPQAFCNTTGTSTLECELLIAQLSTNTLLSNQRQNILTQNGEHASATFQVVKRIEKKYG